MPKAVSKKTQRHSEILAELRAIKTALDSHALDVLLMERMVTAFEGISAAWTQLANAMDIKGRVEPVSTYQLPGDKKTH
jgi:sulfate adenylyltransferase subunit 1 (EFTu-like GTPase family)